jgi:signal transduction histidine kinase
VFAARIGGVKRLWWLELPAHVFRPGELWRALRAALTGLAVAVLSMAANIVLFVLTIVSLVLIPLPFIGFTLFPLVATITRGVLTLHRRMARWVGVDIPSPYRPAPSGAPIGTLRRFRHTLSDPATWLDFAWLIPGTISGFVLGLVSFAVTFYGLEGVLHIPVLIYGLTGGYGYGVVWPFDNWFEAWTSVPQGALLLTLGLTTAPFLMWVHMRFSKFFLAPTKNAALEERVQVLTDTRAEAVDAQAAELRRIERDLHDGAQARLVSLSMNIGLAEELIRRDPDAALKLLEEARESSGTALNELRHLVRGIHPPVLAERGLDGAVQALALTVPATVTVDIDLPGRLEAPVESAVYFAVAEVLANIAKHSDARTAWVHVRHDDGRLAIGVGDDGAGGADPTGGTGLRGIERRLAAFDGTMMVSSPPGGPTVVTMELPCMLSSPKTSPSSGTA